MYFGTVVRFISIGLGIMSAVLLARDGLRFPLNAYLDAVVTSYDDTFHDIAVSVFEPIINGMFLTFDQLFNVRLELHPHWKHFFTLTWLYFGSSARARIPLWGGQRPSIAFEWIWAGICAFAAGAFSGTVSLSNPAVFMWVILFYGLYELGILVWHSLSGGIQSPRAATRFITKYVVAHALVSAAIGFAMVRNENWGLVSLIVLLIVIACHHLWWGLKGLSSSDSRPFIAQLKHAMFVDDEVKIAVNILSVLGSAATLIYLGHGAAQ
jgi:hypothetical protein